MEEKEYESILEARRKKIETTASKCLLTVSAGDYAKSVGKNLTDFNLGSVFSVVYDDDSNGLEEKIWQCEERLIKKAETMGAIVVTDVNVLMLYDNRLLAYQVFMMGTALIPKKQ